MRDGEVLRAEFSIRNDTSIPITVDEIVPHCTCTTILPKGHAEPPFTLSPGEATTFAVTTNLTSRFGPQSYPVSIVSSAAGRELTPVRGRIDVVVDSPLAPYPSFVDGGILEPAQELKRRVVLADTLDSSTVTITSISASDPSSIEVLCAPTDEVVQEGNGYTLRGRYALEVTIKADDRKPLRQELLTIALSDARELRVPVAWSVALPFEVSPRELAITGVEPGQKVQRSVLVRFDGDQQRSVRIAAVSPQIDAKLEQFSEREWRVGVALVAPEPANSAKYQIVLDVRPDGERITIPVVFHYD
jgi:hypothetical protein